MVSHLEKSCSACITSSSERCVSCRARIPICCKRRAFATAVHFNIGPVPVSGDEHPLMLREANLVLAWWPFGGGMSSGSIWFGFGFHSFRLGGGSPCGTGRTCGSGVPPSGGPCASSGSSSADMGLHLPATGAMGRRPVVGEPGREEKLVE